MCIGQIGDGGNGSGSSGDSGGVGGIWGVDMFSGSLRLARLPENRASLFYGNFPIGIIFLGLFQINGKGKTIRRMYYLQKFHLSMFKT